MSEQIVHLENDFIEVGVVPSCGAALAYFRTKGERLFDVMRPASQTAIGKKDALGMSMFPMIPYAFRIKDGEFTYWGIKRFVPQNHPNFSEPLHGDGWRSKWDITAQDKTSLTLSLTHDKETDKGYPFSYKASITYRLKDKTLQVEMNLTNTGLMPMPCGLGVHPYFNKTPNVTLGFKTKNVWYHENDPIDHPYRTPEEWSFEQPKELGNEIFDTCFGGFDGSAHIKWPKFSMGVQIDCEESFSHLALFAPYRKNFFCLEPSTMTCNAFNLASKGVVGSGIQSIGKDETLSGSISFTVEGV